MKARIISSAILIAVMILFLSFAHIPFVLNVGVAAISVAALYETLIVTKYIESKALMGLSLAVSLLIPFLAPIFNIIPVTKHISTSLITAIFVYILVVFITMLVSKDKFSLEHLSFVFLMTIIIPCFFSTIIYSYGLSGALFNVILIFVCSWGSDTGGYVFGGLFGRHRITPKISPKKTFEGLIGSVVTSLSFAVFIAYIGDVMFEDLTVNYVSAVSVGLFGSFCAVLGDLFASVIKRSFGVKDFGSIIPGHGGIMDRFDSVLFAAPFIYIFLSVFPVFTKL